MNIVIPMITINILINREIFLGCLDSLLKNKLLKSDFDINVKKTRIKARVDFKINSKKYEEYIPLLLNIFVIIGIPEMIAKLRIVF